MAATPPSWRELDPSNIIVRMPNWLGDLVMATPVLRDVKRHWPDAKLTAMCPSHLSTLLKHDPALDEILSFKRESGWIRKHFNRSIVERIEGGSYDLGILLTNSLSSAWWFYRGNVKEILGYSGNWRDRLLSEAVAKPGNLEKMHHVDFYKRLLKPLGIAKSESAPRIYVTQEELDEARKCFASLGITEYHQVIGVNPGAAYGPAKMWPSERFRAVIERLLDDPANRVVVFGDADSEPLARKICAGLPPRVVNLAGRTTLREFVALTKACHVFLSNDSGPMHLAAALRVPLLALFGSTNPTKTGPYHWGRVIYKNVSCSPCYKRVCPIDFRCMTRIEVDEVVKEVDLLLRQAFEFRD